MKKHFRPLRLFPALLVFGAIGFGQSPASFAGPRSYLGGSPAVADFNHDGILDLATIDGQTGEVHIHAGLGNGMFAGDEALSLISAPAGSYPIQMLTADLNGDGLPDLIIGVNENPQTGYPESEAIQVFLGKANGGFTASGNYTVPNSFAFLLLADLNSDGKLDLVTVGEYEVALLLGNGDGTFRPETNIIAPGIQVSALGTADFNGDGKLDLAVPTVGGIYILFGDGTGHFPSGTSFTLAGTVSTLTAGDVNNDGKSDLIIESTGGLVQVLLGNGNGTFGTPLIYSIPGVDLGGNYIALGDVNGDGIPDITVEPAAVLIGHGDGTFADPISYATSSFSYHLQLADLRGIARLDMVLDVGNTEVLLNGGAGKFQDGQSIALSAMNAAACVAVADFNGDGHDDAAVSAGNGVEILLGTGTGKGALKPSHYLSLAAATSTCPLAGDFNRDGIADLVVNEGNNDLAFFAGHGDGTFAKPLITTVASPDSLVASVVMGDFNGDGIPDLAANAYPNIELLFGSGKGGFGKPIQMTAPHALIGITAGDLNGDGLTDLVAFTQTQVVVYLNSGKGAFQPQTYTFAPLIYSVVIADVNKDGIPDMVAIGEPTSYVLLGQGGGVFTQTTTLTAVSGVTGLAVDLNGDGLPDLAVNDESEIKVFLGDGVGNFTSPGNPDGLWFAIAGRDFAGAFAAANLQSQSATTGLADLVTLGNGSEVGYVGELINQGVAAAVK